MALRSILDLIIFAVVFFQCSESARPDAVAQHRDHHSKVLQIHDTKGADGKLFESNNLPPEERNTGAIKAVGMVANAAAMKASMNTCLFLGVHPDTVHKMLKAIREDNESFKYYSRYFFQYYVKYPSEIPKNLPASTLDGIMKARMHYWLNTENLSPPQVFKELGMTGTFASARGHPNYKYFEQYSSMWSSVQDRLSKAEHMD